MGWEIFLSYAKQGEDGARQNHAGWGQRPHPLALPRPIAIPTYEYLLELGKKTKPTPKGKWGEGKDEE